MTDTPADADDRRGVEPVICYPNDSLHVPPLEQYRAARATAQATVRTRIPPACGALLPGDRGQLLSHFLPRRRAGGRSEPLCRAEPG